MVPESVASRSATYTDLAGLWIAEGTSKQFPPAPALSAAKPQAAVSNDPWTNHPTLTALQPSLQITTDCWALLAAPDGTNCKEHYIPKGDREPETAYRKRLDASQPSGFFHDALRTYAGMLNRGSWISLPASLTSVLTDVDGRGMDLGIFLAAADLLVLRDGAALVMVLPPEKAGPARATGRRPCAAAIACLYPACSWYSGPTV